MTNITIVDLHKICTLNMKILIYIVYEFPVIAMATSDLTVLLEHINPNFVIYLLWWTMIRAWCESVLAHIGC